MNVCAARASTTPILHLFTDVEMKPGGSQQHPQLWGLWEQDTFKVIQLSNVTKQCGKCSHMTCTLTLHESKSGQDVQVTVLQLQRRIMHE